MSRRLVSFAALLLALLGPALVFLAAGRWILAPGERAAPSPVAVVQAQRLAANPPGILLLGSSKAATDLDPAVLATTLGTAAPVVAIEVPASSAPASSRTPGGAGSAPVTRTSPARTPRSGR